MNILICGSRNWIDVGYIDRLVVSLVPGSPTIVHGDAPGADTIAGYCSHARGLKVIPCPANWNALGKSAGPIRNQEMLNVHNISFVVAFTYNLFESSGTRDMVQRSLAARLTVLLNPSSMGNLQQVVRSDGRGGLFVCREDAWRAY